MNILFFLTPKSNTEYVFLQSTIRQTTEKMDIHGYTAIPVIDQEGKYVKTIAEGDILHFIKNDLKFDLEKAEQCTIASLQPKKEIHAIRADANMEDLFGLALSQNFIPVVDDYQHYIGIIRRREILSYFFNLSKETHHG